MYIIDVTSVEYANTDLLSISIIYVSNLLNTYGFILSFCMAIIQWPYRN